MYTYVKSESLPGGTKIGGAAEGHGLYARLRLNVSRLKTAQHLDELVCDLCWEEERF